MFARRQGRAGPRPVLTIDSVVPRLHTRSSHGVEAIYELPCASRIADFFSIVAFRHAQVDQFDAVVRRHPNYCFAIC
jgi:hypothetical protein